MSFLAFELMVEMWFDQEKLDVRMTPRYLTAVTLMGNFRTTTTLPSTSSVDTIAVVAS